MHRHHDFVLYALTARKRRLTLGDGKTIIREVKAGDILWLPAQAHSGENVCTSETHAVVVEPKEKIKPVRSKAGRQAEPANRDFQ